MWELFVYVRFLYILMFHDWYFSYFFSEWTNTLFSLKMLSHLKANVFYSIKVRAKCFSRELRKTRNIITNYQSTLLIQLVAGYLLLRLLLVTIISFAHNCDNIVYRYVGTNISASWSYTSKRLLYDWRSYLGYLLTGCLYISNK